MAGSMAFKQAAEQASAVLLEPIMTVTVTVPEDSVGDVIGDLNVAPRPPARHGAEGLDDRGQGRGADGRDAHATRPTCARSRAARATTRWSSPATRRFPSHLAQKVIAAGRGRGGGGQGVTEGSSPLDISAVKKELRPFHDAVSCDICGRTILKGERAESYLVPGGERKLVCDLCASRALHEGWIRESGSRRPARRAPPPRAARLAARPPAPSPPLRARHRRRSYEPDWDELDARDSERRPAPAPRERRPPPREAPRDPRHVRAVPTNAEVKVERALELFNGSEHTALDRRDHALAGRALGRGRAGPGGAEPGGHPDRVGAFLVPLPRRSGRRAAKPSCCSTRARSSTSSRAIRPTGTCRHPRMAGWPSV